MSGARHASLFLDMLAAERGASKNTLDAYRRDLDDYLA
jgi:integrase/recombinase XerD